MYTTRRIQGQRQLASTNSLLTRQNTLNQPSPPASPIILLVMQCTRFVLLLTIVMSFYYLLWRRSPWHYYYYAIVESFFFCVLLINGIWCFVACIIITFFLIFYNYLLSPLLSAYGFHYMFVLVKLLDFSRILFFSSSVRTTLHCIAFCRIEDFARWWWWWWKAIFM